MITQPRTVLLSILHQIAWISESEIAQPIREALGRRQAELSYENCVALIRLRISESLRTTIIIDALDECEKRNDLLDSLVKIHDDFKPKLRLLLTSQEHIAVDNKKWFPRCLKIKLPYHHIHWYYLLIGSKTIGSITFNSYNFLNIRLFIKV
jgi:hypothetical protein